MVVFMVNYGDMIGIIHGIIWDIIGTVWGWNDI